MRRLAPLALALVPLLAAGEFRNVGASPGTVNDVYLADAGLVVVSGNTGAAAISATDAGVSTLTSLSGAFIGAGYFGNNCLAALTSTRTLTFTTSCGTSTGIGSGSANRYRVLPSGVAIASLQPLANQDALFVAPTPDGAYLRAGGTLQWLNAAGRSMQHARINGADLVVQNGLTQLAVSVDAGAPLLQAVGFATRDAVPFERNGQVAALTVSSANALALFPDILASTASTTLIVPGSPTLAYVAMTTTGGSDAGVGYGLLTTATGQVFSPVPDPAHVGEQWVARVGAPTMSDRVHCLDARTCVGVDTSGNVQLLVNASPPVVSLDAGSVQPGAMVRLAATTSDPDGDPVFASWSSPMGTLAPVANTAGHEADFTAPAAIACSQSTIPITVTISDGLGAHDRQQTFDLAVARVPVAPAIMPASAMAPAGLGPVTFTAAAGDGGCSTGMFSWSTSDGQMGAGSTFSYQVPATLCDAMASTRTVTVTDNGVQSTAMVQVMPWGAPNTPVFPMPASQPAGTTRFWAPTDQAHTCASTMGFPGTVLEWTTDGGPPGVTIMPGDGGLFVTAADVCTPLVFSATATRRVVGEMFGRVSDAGELTVSIVPDLQPLNASTPFSMGLGYDAGGSTAVGRFTVGANCAAERGLSAEVEIMRPDAAVVADAGFTDVPGDWALTIPGGCNGGTFEVTARLFEDGGFTGAVDRGTIMTVPLRVAAGPVTPDSLEVSCGSGASGVVRLEPVAGTCEGAAITWTQTGGPELVESVLTGRDVTMRTRSTGFDTVGSTLAFDVRVDATGDNVITEQRAVRLTAAPFVEVTHAIGPVPVRAEESALVTVTLRNTSACAAQGLELRESLAGLKPAGGTVRVGAQTVEATVEGDTMIVPAIDLPAKGTVTVSFTARPRLLARATAEGRVFLRDVPVTIEAAAPPASGCGCASAPGAGWLVILVLVAARRRARR